MFRWCLNFSAVAKKPEKDRHEKTTDTWVDIVPIQLLVNPHRRNPINGGYNSGGSGRLDWTEVIILCRDKDDTLALPKDIVQCWEEFEANEAVNDKVNDGYNFCFFFFLDDALAMDGERKRAERHVPTPQENAENEPCFSWGRVEESDFL